VQASHRDLRSDLTQPFDPSQHMPHLGVDQMRRVEVDSDRRWARATPTASLRVSALATAAASTTNEQPVRGRSADAEPVSRLCDGQPALKVRRGGAAQGMVDAADRVGRGLLVEHRAASIRRPLA
jgi:hypothetical protein